MTIKTSTIAGLGMLALGLSACQTVSLPGGGGPFAGQWASADGVFLATLERGQFTSRSIERPDVTLAQGTYTVTGPGGLRLSWFSQSQNASLSADCTAAGRTALDCTPSRGTPFRLVRRGRG